MSIINDALRKAEREANGSKIKTVGIELQRKKKGWNWGPVFILLVLLVVTGPIVAPLFSTPFRQEPVGLLQTAVPSAVVSPTADTRHGQFGIEEMARPAAFMKTPGFSLTGLVYSERESYCLINNQVVKQGEFIQGAKLVEVTPEQAILDYRGQRIVLAAN